MLGKPGRYWLDLLERVFFTFVAGFAAEWAVSDYTADMRSVKIAAAAAVVTTVKTLIGGFVGNRDTASTLPAKADPAS